MVLALIMFVPLPRVTVLTPAPVVRVDRPEIMKKSVAVIVLFVARVSDVPPGAEVEVKSPTRKSTTVALNDANPDMLTVVLPPNAVEEGNPVGSAPWPTCKDAAGVFTTNDPPPLIVTLCTEVAA